MHASDVNRIAQKCSIFEKGYNLAMLSIVARKKGRTRAGFLTRCPNPIKNKFQDIAIHLELEITQLRMPLFCWSVALKISVFWLDEKGLQKLQDGPRQQLNAGLSSSSASIAYQPTVFYSFSI